MKFSLNDFKYKVFCGSTQKIVKLGFIKKAIKAFVISSIEYDDNTVTLITKETNFEIPKCSLFNIFDEANVTFNRFLEYVIACINFQSQCYIYINNSLISVINVNDIKSVDLSYIEDGYTLLNKVLTFTDGYLPIGCTGSTIDIAFELKHYLEEYNLPLLNEISKIPKSNINNLVMACNSFTLGYYFDVSLS